MAWKLDDGVDLTWHEELPAANLRPPGRQGFGSKLIEATITRQLKGRVDWQWRETGLTCRILLPASALLVGAKSSSPESDSALVAGHS